MEYRIVAWSGERTYLLSTNDFHSKESFILAFFDGTERKEIDTTLLNEREIIVPFDSEYEKNMRHRKYLQLANRATSGRE
uniref:Uncharacterized protein n=1 Tax=Romanomermis culicivorax TaxID=13658 RepID=A0A915KG66_ROMCU